MSKKYRQAALGGTFDRLHRGHKHLVSTALSLADKIMIGVTTNSMNQNKLLSPIIQSYDERVHNLTKYLESTHPDCQIDVLSLRDPYGETITNPGLDAVIVSPLTVPGARAINQLRQEKGLPPIAIEVTDMVTDTTGEYLSSTRIRQGKVSRSGQVYRTLFNQDIILSSDQKQAIREPSGDWEMVKELTLASLAQHPAIALVGDRVTEYFCSHRLPFQLAVIDYHIKREPHQTRIAPWQPATTYRVTNPAGSLLSQASLIVFDAIDHPQSLVIVTGEDDLLGFPVALSLPLGSALIFGQPGQGMVKCTITENYKNNRAHILNSTWDNSLIDN